MGGRCEWGALSFIVDLLEVVDVETLIKQLMVLRDG